MSATPFLLSIPSSDVMPYRTLRNGVSDIAISAGSSADAVAFVKAQHGADMDAMWDAATATAIVAATSMAGWALRLKIVTPLGVTLFDHTAEADGTNTDFVKATGTLTLTPGAIADDVVKIDTTYYKFAADPTTGTPDGTVGNPYLVAKGASDTAAFANLRKAINATGSGGVDYAAEITVAHATVESTASNATTLSARALTAGSAGNSISTTVTATGGADGLAWGATTLTGGVGATDQLSSLGLKMAKALNDTSDIAGASWTESTHILKVAETTDSLGDHRVFAYVIPTGADRSELIGVPGFVASQVDGGLAGAALSVTLVADSYVIPKVWALLGRAV